ncbi:MAG: hypothetical protein FWD64_08455 [Acidobacteriaceae bacterium]|nr:hypothetical protein [Acidobacteriaceae bacterium]
MSTFDWGMVIGLVAVAYITGNRITNLESKLESEIGKLRSQLYSHNSDEAAHVKQFRRSDYL